MTSMIVERFSAPTSVGAARMLELTRRRAADELAARTVWCVTGLPAHRDVADRLRAHLEQARDAGVLPRSLDVAAEEPLAALARRLDEMLGGARGRHAALGPAEQETCTDGLEVLSRLLEAVGRDDVVVVHDPLTVMLAPPLRDRGAHVVWRLGLADARGHAGTREAWGFLDRYTAAVDAFVVTWEEPVGPGAAVEHVAALMPAADRVAEKDVAADRAARIEAARDVAWSSLLADVAQEDRGEHVGGRLHPRPGVAVR
jgi:trehalose synthase